MVTIDIHIITLLFKADDNKIDRIQHEETCRQCRYFHRDCKHPTHFLDTRNFPLHFVSLDDRTNQQVALHVGMTVGMIHAKNHDYDLHRN